MKRCYSQSESHEEQVKITKLETEIKEMQEKNEKEKEEQLQSKRNEVDGNWNRD